MFPFDLRVRRFIGIIVNSEVLNIDPDTKYPKTKYGEDRYKVHIPELMPYISKCEGIWAVNDNYLTKRVLMPCGVHEVFGKKISLRNGDQHFIIFVENDINSAHILEPTGHKESPCKRSKC